MKDEGRKVHGDKAVQTDNGGLAGFERENHVPDCGSVERGKPGAQASWSPVQDWDCDDIWQAPESTEQETTLCVKFLIVDNGGNGARRGCGGDAGGRVISHHVGKLSVESEGWVVEFITILSLSKGGDRLKVVL